MRFPQRRHRGYLDLEFGPGKLVYDGRKQTEPSFPHQQKQGIIAFDWIGPTDGS
jgi:hypothetical protein